jgi:hypothetical protein
VGKVQLPSPNPATAFAEIKSADHNSLRLGETGAPIRNRANMPLVPRSKLPPTKASQNTCMPSPAKINILELQAAANTHSAE